MSLHPPTPEEQAAISANNCVPLTRKITSTIDLSADRALTLDNIPDGATRVLSSSTATAIAETGGPTTLVVGAVGDGQFTKRVGSTLVGATVAAYDPTALAATGGTENDVRHADTLTSGEAVTLGYAVGIKNASGVPKAYKASAASASTPGLTVGIATATVGNAGLPLTVQSSGLSPIIPDAAWDTLPAVTDVGSVVYLSKTAGKLCLDTSAFTTTDRVQSVGKLAVGGTGACKVMLAVAKGLTATESQALDNLSGTNTGNETATTIKSALGISTLSGSNTGDQTITLSTDLSGSGTNTVAATIVSKAVTLAKMADLAANSIIGNNTASPATPLALTVAQVKTLLAMVASDVGAVPVTHTINAQTGETYQPTLADAYEGGRQLTTLDNANPITVTLPLEATVGFVATYGTPSLNFVQKGAGKVTFVAESGGSIVPAATPSIAAQDGAVSAIPVGSGVWRLVGSLSA